MASIRELIIDDMVTALEAVTEFGGRVYKLIPEDPSAATLPFCCVFFQSEQLADWGYGIEFKTLLVDVVVAAAFDQETATEAGSATVDALLVLAQKALAADVHRGGRATLTEFLEQDIAEDRDEFGFLTGKLTVSIPYRHVYGDPEALIA